MIYTLKVKTHAGFMDSLAKHGGKAAAWWGRQNKATKGAIIGAAGGATIGAARGGVKGALKGAAVGGAVGGAAGYGYNKFKQSEMGQKFMKDMKSSKISENIAYNAKKAAAASNKK